MKLFSLPLILCLVYLQCANSLDLRKEVFHNTANFKQHFEELHKANNVLKKLSPALSKISSAEDLSVDCALCGIAINEVEGWVQENISVSDMEKFLKKDVCDHLVGDPLKLCLDILAKLPEIVSTLDHRFSVSVVCVNLGYCKKPFQPKNETLNVQRYQIDLDKSPSQRFIEVCSVPEFQKQAQFLINTIDGILADGGKYLSDIGKAINAFFPSEYAEEIQGCAAALGVDFGWLSLMNIGYEVSDACTSIVAQDSNGKIFHGRNLDFGPGMGFSDSLKNMTIIAEMQKGGVTQYIMTTYAGYVGALSGQRPKVFSVTIDTRFYPKGIGELFYEIIAAILEKNAQLVSFLSRDALATQTTFSGAVSALSKTELIADVYYITAGTTNDQGTVISRNRQNATNIWTLNVPSRWFEVETNYDHWLPPPWFDDRRVPAEKHMDAMGRQNLNVANLFKVMSTKPTLNLETTYTMISVPSESYYETYVRYCPFPCVQ